MLISGRSLALECNWNCCPRYPDLRRFSYTQARYGDRVFINIDFIRIFLSSIIQWGIRGKKFIIACQNSDTQFNHTWLARLRPYALHIYTINSVIQDPMITTIPIGFGDWSLDIIPDIKASAPRTIEILAGFIVSTNPRARQPCLESMQKDPRALTDITKTKQEYYERLCITKYVVCPEGQGHDTHRVYESIYFGAVPILLKPSVLAHLYKDMPIRWVDSWDSIELNWESDKKQLDEWVEKNPSWYSEKLIK
jgi:hypothetical protein